MIKDVLVVGAGSIGRRHIQCLKELGIPKVYICESNDANKSLAEKSFDIAQSFADIGAALQRTYNFAIVAVPNHLHAEVSCKVIEKGIDLIIEKPIETNLDSATRIQHALRDRDNICLIAYCLRFDPAMQKIHDILYSGELGRVYSADVSVGHYLPDWRPGIDFRSTYSANHSQGGGVCLDLSHEIDYFRWLFGEIKEVRSITEKISDLKMDVEDISESILICENGTIGRIHLDYLSRRARRTLYINCSRGCVEYDFINGQLVVNYADEDFCKVKKYNSDRNVMYKNQLNHFCECVIERKKPLITVENAMSTLALALKIRNSKL